MNINKESRGWQSFGTILPLEDYETAIDAPTQDNSPVTAPYYTTSGQRVTAPARGGIYIHNGRKVFVRQTTSEGTGIRAIGLHTRHRVRPRSIMQGGAPCLLCPFAANGAKWLGRRT